MTVDEINQSKLKDVHPQLAARVVKFIEAAKADGVTLQITQGLRTFAEQDKLFIKRPKVTNAHGGQSNHNYGLACDLSPVVKGVISWNENLYKPFGHWAQIAGLQWGGNWKHFIDLPHLELLNCPKWQTLLAWYKIGGVAEVWKHFN